MRYIAPALIFIGLLASGPVKAATDRGVWVWEEDSYAIFLDPDAAATAIDMAKQQRLTTFYLYADAFRDRNLIVTHAADVQRLIKRFHDGGIKVQALLGSWYLHTERYVLTEQRAEALAMFRRVFEFNAAAPPDSRFDAVHFDIEPHQLEEWKKDSNKMLLQFLDLGRAIMDLSTERGNAAPVGPDIPFWFDGITLEWQGERTSVAEHFIKMFNFVTLMDYRNVADGDDGIIAHAAGEMEIARRLGKRVIIGVETGNGELPKTTFRDRTPVDMERELAATEDAFRENPAFAGFAIHHYGTYRSLLSKSASPN